MKKPFKKTAKPLYERTPVHFATVAMMGVLAAILVLLYGIYHQYPETVAARNAVALREGLALELAYLSGQGNEVARLPEVIEAIRTENTDALNTILPRERDARGIGLLGAANRDGIIISRTRSTRVIGDNAFQNGPVGRALVQRRNEVASVEQSTIDPRQILLNTGRFVYADGAQVGALFVNRLADDEFARYVAKEYLAGSELIFYTNEYGIYGSSFTHPGDMEVIRSYVMPDSDIINNPKGEGFLRLSNGHLYLVKNYIFPGLESSPGGVVVFTELPDILAVAGLGCFLPPLAFMFILFVVRRRRGKKDGIICSPTLAFFLIPYVLVYTIFVLALYNHFPQVKSRVYPLYNSVLRLLPDGGVFDPRFSQRITAVIDSGGEAINAIKVSLAYNPAELVFESFDTERSICEYIITADHDPISGSLDFECIIPDPGFAGDSAVVLDAYFTPVPGASSASVVFRDDSQILANDGLATDVLRMAAGTSIRFEKDILSPDAARLGVFASSHPNPAHWYPSRDVLLSWLPSLPGTVLPDEHAHTAGPFGAPPISKSADSDGVHTFTVEAPNSLGKLVRGSVTVRIDTQPPEELELLASETTVKPGGLVRFTATGSDSLSGLQRTFYLKINDEIFFPIGKEIYIPFPESGVYTVTLRAYDQAGNFRDVSRKIQVGYYQ